MKRQGKKLEINRQSIKAATGHSVHYKVAKGSCHVPVILEYGARRGISILVGDSLLWDFVVAHEVPLFRQPRLSNAKRNLIETG